MTARCYLRNRDGTLLVEVESPSVEQECTWQRRGAGQCRTSMPSTDPAVSVLAHSSPSDGVIFKTAYDSDIELAWWGDGLTPGTDPPTWAGPVVSVVHEWGKVTVTAFTQEWYLTRSVVGGDLANHLDFATPGNDPSRSEWTVGGGSWTTTTTDLFTEDAAFVAGAFASVLVSDPFTLPVSPGGNVVQFAVAVKFPAGAVPPFGIVGAVGRFDDPGGGSSFPPSPSAQAPIPAPTDWEPGRWYVLGVTVQQPAGYGTQWIVSLMGDTGTTFGAVRGSRPGNASAVAGADWASAASAILNQQTDLLPAGFTYDTDPTGVTLAGPMRWLSQDHEDVVSALGDLDGMGEWWVEEGPVLRWAPTRGSLVGSLTLTAEDLAGWSYEVDASNAATEVIAQMRPDTGNLREQIRLALPGSGSRLVRVEQVPDTIHPADATTWADAVLLESAPACSMNGTPAVFDGDPEDVLGDIGLGDWVEVTITDGSVPPYTVEPAVDRLSWHPVTGKVTPTWVLGGGRAQDPIDLLVAELREARRLRRKFEPQTPPLLGALTAVEVMDVDYSGGDLNATQVTETVDVPSGLWSVLVEHSISGADPAGFITAAISGAGPTELVGGAGAALVRHVAEVRGPASVAIAGVVSGTGGTITDRRMYCRMERVA